MVLGKCCFIIPLRQAVIIIGLLSMTVSLAGILLSTSSVLHSFPVPEDPLVAWILRVCFFVEVPGIVFHTILFIVSTILECGVLSRIPPLLVPWLGWCPFVVTGIAVQMILVVVKKPSLSLPIVAFCGMLLLFVIYASLVVAAYYRDVMHTVQLRIFDIGNGELPRIVRVPRRYFRRNQDAAPVVDGASEPSTSERPLHEDQQQVPKRSAMKQNVIDAYARLLHASRRPFIADAQQALQQQPQRF